ncbi:MAG: bacillithiol biosynthesis cysteine-adding enzyme BshC [Planctomycetota bacterium]
MSPTLRHVPFRRMGTSEVHQRYLDEDRDLAMFVGRRPRTAEELLRRAPTNAGRLLAPAILSEALLAYARRFDAPQPVIDNARAVASGEVRFVVTGQQPGILGGPLYNLFKVATAIRLCRELESVPGSPKSVPLFWNHSDDHDIDEANRFFYVNKAMEVQRCRLEIERSGGPLRSLPAGREVKRLLSSLDDLIPENEHRRWALSLLEPRHPDEKLGEGLTRLLFDLFGERGLLVIEPRDLPREAFAPLERWWKEAPRIRETVRQTCDDLGGIGVDVTLDPSSTLMFEMIGGLREPLADAEVFGQDSDLSPGVLLRPLWQDAILPSIAFVVGPGELAYLCVAAPLYKLLGVPQPLFVPRASMTLVEPSLQRLLAKFGWDLPDLAHGPERLIADLQGNLDDGIEDEIDELALRVTQEIETLSARVASIDASMLASLDRAKGKIADELGRVAQKLRNSRQNKEGAGSRQIRRLCSNLRPRGRLQERVLSPLQFLCSYGPALADWIVEAADPFHTEHGVLEL